MPPSASLLQCVKSNALRLDVLSRTELMQMVALTPAQLVIFKLIPHTDIAEI